MLDILMGAAAAYLVLAVLAGLATLTFTGIMIYSFFKKDYWKRNL